MFLLLIVSCFFFFFFQAEDGIRDHCVTGVQTCALPICHPVAGLSDISTRSGASMIWTSMRRKRLATGWRASSLSIAAASPTSSSPTCRCRAATSAPSTMADGPASPPMASTAMRSGLLLDRLDLAAVVVAAVGAHLVRQFHLVALRTLAAADRLQRVVRAALGRAGLRVSAFGIRHDVYVSLVSQSVSRSCRSSGSP